MSVFVLGFALCFFRWEWRFEPSASVLPVVGPGFCTRAPKHDPLKLFVVNSCPSNIGTCELSQPGEVVAKQAKPSEYIRRRFGRRSPMAGAPMTSACASSPRVSVSCATPRATPAGTSRPKRTKAQAMLPLFSHGKQSCCTRNCLDSYLKESQWTGATTSVPLSLQGTWAMSPFQGHLHIPPGQRVHVHVGKCWGTEGLLGFLDRK